MNILLYHCSFHNQGDTLMLLATKNIFEKIHPDSKFFVLSKDNPNKELLSKENIKEIKLDFKYLQNRKTLFQKAQSKIYRVLRRKDLYNFNKIKVVVDVNGYFLGDRWGVHLPLYEDLIFFKKQKKKIIFMPKSFGPFNDSVVTGYGNAIISCVDLIFARDVISYREILKINPAFEHKVFLNSDYTSICEHSLPEEMEKYQEAAMIIINNRMVWQNAEKHKIYLDFIIKCQNILDSLDMKYYFLLHDYKRDVEFLKILNIKKERIIFCPDPRRLKGFASVSKLVISSRYHGILNALNTRTPIIGTSWAHKYDMIAEEYEITDYIVDIDISSNNLERTIASALSGRQAHIVRKERIEDKRKVLIQELSMEIQRILDL